MEYIPVGIDKVHRFFRLLNSARAMKRTGYSRSERVVGLTWYRYGYTDGYVRGETIGSRKAYQRQAEQDKQKERR